MRRLKKLLPLLNIRPGEERLVASMVDHHFLISVAWMFVYTPAYSLFLIEFDAGDLPFIYIGTSIVAALVSVVYLRLSSRFAFRTLLAVNLGFLLAITLALHLLLGTSVSRWAVFALPIFAEILWVLTNLEFWGLAGRLFDVRQGKRLFGLLGGSLQAGDILSGLLTPLLVAMLGTRHLLLICAVALAGTMLSLFSIQRAFADSLAGAEEEDSASAEEPPASGLLKKRYVIYLFGQLALGTIVFYAIDKIFYDQATLRYPDADQLSAFLGLFYAVSSIATLLATNLPDRHRDKPPRRCGSRSWCCRSPWSPPPLPR